jgi:hypothetical protein
MLFLKAYDDLGTMKIGYGGFQQEKNNNKKSNIKPSDCKIGVRFLPENLIYILDLYHQPMSKINNQLIQTKEAKFEH